MMGLWWSPQNVQVIDDGGSADDAPEQLSELIRPPSVIKQPEQSDIKDVTQKWVGEIWKIKGENVFDIPGLKY